MTILLHVALLQAVVALIYLSVYCLPTMTTNTALVQYLDRNTTVLRRQSPVHPSSASNYVRLGCYTEGYNTRALAPFSYVNYEAMAPSICVSKCSTNNYTYIGVEFGGECYCGNTINNGSVPVDDTECSTPCDKYPGYYCGGPDHLDLYSATSTSNLPGTVTIVSPGAITHVPANTTPEFPAPTLTITAAPTSVSATATSKSTTGLTLAPTHTTPPDPWASNTWRWHGLTLARVGGIIMGCFAIVASGLTFAYMYWWFKREVDDQHLLPEEEAPWWVNPFYKFRRILPLEDRHTPKRTQPQPPRPNITIVLPGETDPNATPHHLGPRSPPSKPKEKFRPLSLTASLMQDSPQQSRHAAPGLASVPKTPEEGEEMKEQNSSSMPCQSAHFAANYSFGPDIEVGEGPSKPWPRRRSWELTPGDIELRELDRRDAIRKLEGTHQINENNGVIPMETSYKNKGKEKESEGNAEPKSLAGAFDPIRARAERLLKQKRDEDERKAREEAAKRGDEEH